MGQESGLPDRVPDSQLAPDPPGLELVRHLLAESTLADAGLAPDEHQFTLARDEIVQTRLEFGQVALTAGQTATRRTV